MSTSSTDQAARIVWGPTESGAGDPVMVWARVWAPTENGRWESSKPAGLERETALAWVLNVISERAAAFVEIYPTERAAAVCRTRDMLASVGRDNDTDDLLDQLAGAGLIIR